MMSKSRSVIWEYFEKTPNAEVVTCKLCHASVKPCSNTTNIRNHIKRNHPSIKQSKVFVVSKIGRIPHSVATCSTEPLAENVDDPDVVTDDIDFAEVARNIVTKVRY